MYDNNEQKFKQPPTITTLANNLEQILDVIDTKSSVSLPTTARPVKSRGKACVESLDSSGFILKDMDGVSFKALASEDLFLIPTVGDLVLYEYLDEDDCYILHILKSNNATSTKRTVRLPDNAMLLSANELELLSRSIVQKSIEQTNLSQNIRVSSSDISVSCKTSYLNADLSQENLSTKMLTSEVYKTNITKIADEHHANSRLKVDNAFSLGADRVKLNAKGHVDIDGEKINMG
jgi:hypothetical protein